MNESLTLLAKQKKFNFNNIKMGLKLMNVFLNLI
jgi:hypothetical protein